MVMMAPSSILTRSLSPNMSFNRNVPVMLLIVPQGVNEFSLLVSFYIDYAMATIHARVGCFDRNIHIGPFTAASDQVIPFF